MPVYVTWNDGELTGYLSADKRYELREFAKKIGLGKADLQRKNSKYEHIEFKASSAMFLAQMYGANFLSPKNFAERQAIRKFKK